MRKYILSIILILCGLTILIVNYSNIKNPTYTETAFADQASRFDKLFESFTHQVKENIFIIKKQYGDTLKIRDTLASRMYFLNVLDKHKNLNSIGFFQDNYKLVAKKEKNSRVFTLDSSEQIGVVKWIRIENGKVIGNWFESLEETIYNTSMYKDLISKNDQLKWYLRKRAKFDNINQDQEFIYAAYAYNAEGKQSSIVFEFSRNVLFNEFNINSGKIKPRLSFKDLNGKELHLNTSLTEFPMDSSNQNIKVDSLQIIIDRHFTNFKEVQQGTFNFDYNNQIYWTSFKQLSHDTGIQHYLYTVPNSQLSPDYSGILKGYGGGIGISLIVLGGILLIIRKRFFYRPNKMRISSVKDILKQDEDRYLEFKSSLRWDYRQEKTNPELEKVIMKTIAAFGNTDGGILLIGVDDDKNILGLEKDFQTLKKKDADYYEVHLRNIMHKLMGVKYVSKYIRTQFEVMEDDKLVCKIKVISAKEPLYLKYKNKNGLEEEKFYVRSGNSSHEIKSIAEINDYINSKFK